MTDGAAFRAEARIPSAGDTFSGAVLHKILNCGSEGTGRLEERAVREIAGYANAAGALCAVGFGSTASMPPPARIKELLVK